MSNGPITIYRDFDFDAAHWLPNVPDGHKCKTLHGHTYQLTIWLTGDPDPALGWLIDYADMDRIVRDRVLYRLDHQCLNVIAGLENPTTENLVVWIWERLQILALEPHRLTVEIREGTRNGCMYSGPSGA